MLPQFFEDVILKADVEYIIPFRGLSEGIHEFTFFIDKLFFRQFENADINNGFFTVKVKMTNRPNFLFFEFHIEGTAEVPCDRCLDYLSIAIKSQHHLSVKFGNKENEETEDLLIIPQAQSAINLARYIYEYISLSLPVKRTHEKESMCNQEVIQRLYKPKEKKEKAKTNDPRWDELKKLVTKK